MSQNLRRIVVSLVFAVLAVFCSISSAFAGDEGRSQVIVAVTDAEERPVAAGIAWINESGIENVPVLKIHNIDVGNPVVFEVQVGQNYRLMVTDGATGHVINQRVFARNAVRKFQLPKLERPTLKEQVAKLAAEKDALTTRLRDTQIDLAIAQVDKRDLEKDKQTMQSQLDVAWAYNAQQYVVIADLNDKVRTHAQEMSNLSIKVLVAQQAQRDTEVALAKSGVEVTNLANQLKASQDQAEFFRQRVSYYDTQLDVQGVELESLRAENAALRSGSATGRGLVCGVNYVGSWAPRTTYYHDTPVYVDLYNDSVFQTHVGEVGVLFTGPPVDGNIAPFSMMLMDHGSDYQLWGGGTVINAVWRGDLGGWLVSLPVNKFIDAKGHSLADIRFDSRSFRVQPGQVNEVSISVISTHSYDGVSVQVGSDHGSGTVVVQYQQ